MASGNAQETPKDNKAQDTKKNRWRRLTPAIIIVGVLIAVLLGIRGCISSTRRSVAAKAPNVELPPASRYDKGIPVYEDDIVLAFESNVAFVEIVTDSLYQRKKAAFLRKLFPGCLLGGDIEPVSEEKQLVILIDKYRGTDHRKYWVRAACQTGTVKYKETLDRLIYSLVGRIVDGMCGYLVGRVGPGGLYGPDEFPQYAIGSFKPLIISQPTK